MKLGLAIATVIAVLAVGAGIYMIDIDQTQEAQLPEVSIEGGQLPNFEAEVGDVRVTEETVTVPSVEVVPPEDDRADLTGDQPNIQ
ncbi:hypothetical protein [Tropicimonas sp. S265A]|uniref:hypothetical protein n=1 Tax=Tropicimonas sp. S265A TaxID=3415134 RepID=UPI003C7DB10A